MFAVQWLIAHWSIMVGESLTAVAFGVLGYVQGMKIKRADVGLEIKRAHHELWQHFDEHQELWGLHDKNRIVAHSPLTPFELRFANRLFLHVHAAYRASRAGTYKLPEHLGEDLRDVFACPALREAWRQMKRFHDGDFVAFVEKHLE